MNFVKEPAAEKELIDAAAFYDRQRPGLGDRFIDEFERVVTLLIEHPELGVRVGDDRRVIVLNRFPFRLVYVLEDSGIRIIAVAHQKRRPDFWRGRVAEPRPGYAILQQAA
jgi:toxin ParE1/3/4